MILFAIVMLTGLLFVIMAKLPGEIAEICVMMVKIEHLSKELNMVTVVRLA